MRHRMYSCSCALLVIISCFAMSACGDINSNFAEEEMYDTDASCEASLCHVSTTLGLYPPRSGKHESHLSPALNMTCDDCHSGYLDHPLHKDRILNGYDSVNETQTGGDIIFFSAKNADAVWDNSTGTCANMSCHGTVSWYTTEESSCQLCHGPGLANDPLVLGGDGINGKHSIHAQDLDYSCETCHSNYKTNPLHMNGQLDSDSTAELISFEGEDSAVWNNSTGTCDNLSCHGSVSWYTTEESTCQLCHASGLANDPMTLNGSGSDGKHVAHVGEHGYSCDICHNGYKSNTLHGNGLLDADGAGQIIYFADGFTATWDNSTGTCANLSCHGSINWYTTEESGCQLCHGPGLPNDPLALNGSGSDGKHLTHVSDRGYSCETCHNGYKSNPLHSNGELDTDGLAQLVVFAEEDTATWNNSTATCANLSCHGSVSWYTTEESTCQLCHASGLANDPMTLNGSGSYGKHIAHVGEHGYSCETCHNGYKNNTLHGNGLLDADGAGQIIYFADGFTATWDNSTGTCASLSCHGSISWYTTEELDCVSCHAPGTVLDPLGKGRHSVHLSTNQAEMNGMICETCHYNYRDNAAHTDGTTDLSGMVSFSVEYGGSWNDVQGTCESMSCHGNASWEGASLMTCTSCHSSAYSAYYPDPLDSGHHDTHVGYARNFGYADTCDCCHHEYTNSGTHINGTGDRDNEAVNLVIFEDPASILLLWDDSNNSCGRVGLGCHNKSAPGWETKYW